MSTRSANAGASSASSASSRSSRPIPPAARAMSPSAATRPSPRSPRGLRRKSTASISWPRTSRTRPTTPPASWCWRARQNWAKQGSGPLVTTFVFRVRNLPAALYKALGGFATNGVNMTKLESYMVDGEFSATQFYADVDGHPEDKGLAFALEELKFFSREFRIVGVYPGHPFRATFSEDGGLRSASSSLRTQGPIATERSCVRRRRRYCSIDRSRGMGPVRSQGRQLLRRRLLAQARTHPPADYTTSSARRGRTPR